MVCIAARKGLRRYVIGTAADSSVPRRARTNAVFFGGNGFVTGREAIPVVLRTTATFLVPDIAKASAVFFGGKAFSAAGTVQ